MVAGVRVSFGLTKDEVEPALKKQNRAYVASKRAIADIQGGYKQLEREAVRALKKAGDEQGKLNRITLGLNRLVDQNVISQKAANRAIRQARAELDGTAAARKKDASEVERTTRQLAPVLSRQKAIVRELHRGNIERAQALRLVKSITASSRQVAGSTRSITQSVLGTVTAYFSLHQAISTANRLLQEQIELERGAGEERLTTAQAHAKLVRNTADFPRAERAALFRDIDQLALEIPTATRAQIAQAVATGISATSEDVRGPRGRREDIIDAVRSAANLFPDSASGEEIVSFGQTILDLRKATRGIIDDEKSLNLLLRAASQARITETENLRRLVPALQAIRVAAEHVGEFEPEDIKAGLAFQAVLGSAIGDRQGERVETASSLFVQTLREEIPTSMAKGFADQLGVLIESPEIRLRIRDLVIEQLKGKGATKGSVEAIARQIGIGATFESVLEALDRPVDQTVQDALRTATPELRQQFAIRSAESGVTDALERRVGDSGIFIKLFDEANRAQTNALDRMISKFDFLATRLVASTETAAIDAVRQILLNEQQRVQFGVGDPQTVAVLEDILQAIKNSGAPPAQVNARAPEVQ